MVSLTTFLVSVALGSILYMLFKRNKGKARLPPGPFALPVLGNILSMAHLPHKPFYKWAETYGKMCIVSFGSSKVVVLNDPVLIREAFNDPNFSGRPENEGFVILVDGPHGVLSSSGQDWVDQRRFTLRHLRDFGFGKNVMEELIMEDSGGSRKNFWGGHYIHVGHLVLNAPMLAYVKNFILGCARALGQTHTADVDFYGYHFPKGTRITANHYYVHFNPELWELGITREV